MKRRKSKPRPNRATHELMSAVCELAEVARTGDFSKLTIPDSLDPHDLIAYSDGTAQVVYVIHARNLTDAEKRATRKRG